MVQVTKQQGRKTNKERHLNIGFQGVALHAGTHRGCMVSWHTSCWLPPQEKAENCMHVA